MTWKELNPIPGQYRWDLLEKLITGMEIHHGARSTTGNHTLIVDTPRLDQAK
jgi:hypothetical protein